jgi:hypothetical protein
MPTFSNLRTCQICPYWDFWFEEKPSGNLASHRPETSENWFTTIGKLVHDDHRFDFGKRSLLLPLPASKWRYINSSAGVAFTKISSTYFFVY